MQVIQACPAPNGFDKPFNNTKQAAAWLLAKLGTDHFLYVKNDNIYLDAAEMKRKVLLWAKTEQLLKEQRKQDPIDELPVGQEVAAADPDFERYPRSLASQSVRFLVHILLKPNEPSIYYVDPAWLPLSHNNHLVCLEWEAVMLVFRAMAKKILEKHCEPNQAASSHPYIPFTSGGKCMVRWGFD